MQSVNNCLSERFLSKTTFLVLITRVLALDTDLDISLCFLDVILDIKWMYHISSNRLEYTFAYIKKF